MGISVCLSSFSYLPRRAQTHTAKSEMTITSRVYSEIIEAVPTHATAPKIRRRRVKKASGNSKFNKGQQWTASEHAKFLEAMELFPSGPWKRVAAYIGTKNARQSMTHAQKYRQKHERHMRGLRHGAKTHKTHSTDEEDEEDDKNDSDEATSKSSAPSDTDETISAWSTTSDFASIKNEETEPIKELSSNLDELFAAFDPSDMQIPELWSTHSLETPNALSASSISVELPSDPNYFVQMFT